MSVAVVSTGGVRAHAPSRALVRQLRAAGNQVEVHEHQADTPGLADRMRSLVGSGPRIVHPANRGDVAAAVSLAGRHGLVAAPPTWGLTREHDLAWHAPADRSLSSSPAGRGIGHHLAPAATAGTGRTPSPQRHRGRRVVVVARWTAATPARYLAAACARAGVEVVRSEALDWAEVGDADGVVVVESPLPALPVAGERRDVPVLLWAHHGEHHTDTHVRLVHHYGADAVLLAHSWHLAHRFPRPVHRFPFGLPTSLVARRSGADWVGGGEPFAQRPLDAAFVGSGLDGAGAYTRRGALLDDLRATLGEDRVAFTSGVPPDRIPQLYGSARLVPNDCGLRHRPITMRVLEAVGAGAVLLTDDAPGLDRLLDPAAHHVVIDDPVGEQARALLSRPELGDRAAAALEHARSHHTTDHRVDELVAVLAATTPLPPMPPRPAVEDPLLQSVAADLLLDDVLPLGTDHDQVEQQLPDRVVWEPERLERLADRPLAHAVVVASGWQGDPTRAAAAARRVVVSARPDVTRAALARAPGATVRSDVDGVTTVDLGTPGYRVAPGEDA